MLCTRQIVGHIIRSILMFRAYTWFIYHCQHCRSLKQSACFFLILGLIAAAGFYFLSQAYRLAKPSTIAPFEYSGHLELYIIIFLQNVFEQEVYRPIKSELSLDVKEQIQTTNSSIREFEHLIGRKFADKKRFNKALLNPKRLTAQDPSFIVSPTEIYKIEIIAHQIDAINIHLITEQFFSPLRKLEVRNFGDRWLFKNELAATSVY